MRNPSRSGPRRARAVRAAALAIAALLTSCNAMQAKPVCIGPGVQGMQIAPMYQCEEGRGDRAIVNR